MFDAVPYDGIAIERLFLVSGPVRTPLFDFFAESSCGCCGCCLRHKITTSYLHSLGTYSDHHRPERVLPRGVPYAGSKKLTGFGQSEPKI